MSRRAVDINCDMGESFGHYQIGQDEEIIQHISSANIACGFHAGDPHVMRQTVRLAIQNRVRIGAHPGLPDLAGFGRRTMGVAAEELHDFFIYQIGALKAFVEISGEKLQHVKMHGALLEMALARDAYTQAMCAAVKAVDPNLIWVTPSGTTTQTARDAGLRVAEEFYCDRAYHGDKSLVSRKKPGAVIQEPAEIKKRLVQLFEKGSIATIERKEIDLPFDTICIHGDTGGALDIVRLIRKVCAESGVAVKPLQQLIK